MSKSKKSNKKSGIKRTLMEWGGIAAVFAILYFTGLHTEVLGTMQRAMLWTGLFDGHEITTTDGPILSEHVYNMSLRTPEGKSVHLSDFKGEVLFVNVWASWCPPCVAEMPTIETLYNNVSDHEDIKFLLLSIDEQPAKATEFMEGKEFPMPYYFPTNGLSASFRSPYIPSTYVVSKQGKIVYKKVGLADYSSAAFRNWLVKQTESRIFGDY